MKITPAKNYKKPAYAVGVAALAAIMTMGVTACGPLYAGGMETGVTETEATNGKTKSPSKPEGGKDVELSGEIGIIDPTETEDVMIDGDVAIVDIDESGCIGYEGGETIET